MAKVVELNIPDEYKDLMLKAVRIDNIQGGDFSNAVINKKVYFNTRNKKEALLEISEISEFAGLWDSLTEARKTDWERVGAYNGLTGYQAFIKDTTIAFSYDYTRPSLPNDFHQCYYRRLLAEGSTGEFYLSQDFIFPGYYYVPNVGQKNAYHWEYNEGNFTGSFDLDFNYQSEMEYIDTPDFYDVSVFFTGIKDGDVAHDSFSFNLDLITDWKNFSETMTPDLDLITGITVSFNGYPLNGNLRFDNITLKNNLINLLVNPFCDYNSKLLFGHYSGDNFETFGSWHQDFSDDDTHFYYSYLFS